MNIEKLKIWLKELRAPFFTASSLPVIIGSSLAYNHTGEFNWVNFILATIGCVSANAGTNLINDYYDHISKNDDVNKSYTPFSGGSRIIQNGLLPAKQVFWGGILFFLLTAIIGIYLYFVTPGKTLLYIGILGILIGYFYTAKPVALGYKGVGEFFIFFALGPLAVMGGYFVQTGFLNWQVFWASFPIGLLVAAIVFINQFQDYEADKAVGKKQWVVRLGRKDARFGFYFLIFSIYLIILLEVFFKVITPWSFLVLLTLPLAISAAKVSWKNYEKIQELLPANVATIKMHLLTGVLMSLAFVVDRVV